MKENTVVPYSLVQLYRARKVQEASMIPDTVQVHGYVLNAAEIGEFLFSGNIYGLPDIGEGRYKEIEFIIPQASQRKLYSDLADLRKRQTFGVVFEHQKTTSGSLKGIIGLGQGKTEKDMYVMRARVGQGRRVTSVSYGYFAKQEIFPSVSAGIIRIDSWQKKRRNNSVSYDPHPAI